jgi:prepilin-type N-terminal cleavage/methylation domain-containing protein
MAQHNHRHPYSASRGFTLTEILVVIGIIVLLAGILLPVINRARRQANKARLALDLQALVTALEQYKGDVKDYPRVVAAGQGSQTLADALLGPGPSRVGFSIRVGGKKYGPYIQADKFKIADGSTKYVDVVGKTIPLGCLLDMNGNPILYYSASLAKLDITQPGAFVGSNTTYGAPFPFLYNYADNDDGSEPRFTAVSMLCAMLGDYSGNGAIDGGETAVTTGPYLLWSAGPDGFFGPMNEGGKQLTSSDTPTKADVARSDDVTNFQR